MSRIILPTCNLDHTRARLLHVLGKMACLVLERIAGKVNEVGIFLTLCLGKTLENQAKALSTSHRGIHKHELLGWPSYSPCDFVKDLVWRSTPLAV